MAFGRVKHSNRKIVKSFYSRPQGGRKMVIEVVAGRMAFKTAPGKFKGYYEARACVRQRYTGARMPRCSKLTWGYTPTAAVKRALHALAKSLK
jgi:hypothetical protein